VTLARFLLVGLTAVSLFACSSDAKEDSAVSEPDPNPGSLRTQPEGWTDGVALPLPVDLNDDPDILEVEIEARLESIEVVPGVLTEMWTYNGSVPGPLLRAKKGDRLIVHFTNNLPEPTTIHWHGLRVPSEMDGTEAVQSPVLPGGEFLYDFTLPDAGTFWYHPHVNSGAQVGYGLYGGIAVSDATESVQEQEVVLVLSDVSLDVDGQLLPGDHNGWFGDYFGREGEHILVNGKLNPLLKMRPGVSARFRVINAARSKFFGTEIPSGAMVRVGGDAGLSDRPLPLDQLVVVASERAEVLVTLSEDAEGVLHVPFQDVDRFNTGLPLPDAPLFRIEAEGEPVEPSAPLPEILGEVEELDLEGALEREIELGETEDGQMTINGSVFPGIEDTPHVGYVGDTEVWTVTNTTEYPHPFHLHGFAFQVLDVGGVPWPVREWKDTASIPAKSTLRFAVEYDNRPGLWMFHCHILGHAKLGMMSLLDIRPEAERP